MPQRQPASKYRLGAIAALTLGSWIAYEGFTTRPVIPVKGDVPTIGHGATHYEDGTRVKMSDPPITRKRAAELAAGELERTYAACVARRLGDALVSEIEMKLAVDFSGQYGCVTYHASSMARETINGNYRKACEAYRQYRFVGKGVDRYDCSTLVNGQPNRRCWGVWTRSNDRANECLAQLA